MKTVPWILVVVLAMLACSCNSIKAIMDDQQASYVAVATVFAEVVEAASDARDAGRLSDDSIRRIDANVQHGRMVLAEWRAALAEGGDVNSYAPLMRAIVRQIEEYLAKEKCDGPGKCDLGFGTGGPRRWRDEGDRRPCFAGAEWRYADESRPGHGRKGGQRCGETVGLREQLGPVRQPHGFKRWALA